MSMPLTDLEAAYDMLASAIDQAGPDKELLLLTKFALVLADRVGSIDTYNEALRIALQDLDIEPKPLHAAGDSR